MSTIENFIKDSLQADVPEPPVRFSVNIEYMLNYRLQHIAKTLDYNRAALASKFIELAVIEAEKSLGLNPFDFNSEYSKDLMKHCAGSFHQDETGLYRLSPSGEKIKVVDSQDDQEIDYSLGVGKEDSNE